VKTNDFSNRNVVNGSLESAKFPFDKHQVQQALNDILRSAPFRASKQCQKLLRYIVQHSLTGQDNLLRERVIGTDVFDRAPDYDAANDPIVRARVAEVRKRLALYYVSANPTPIRIEIPSGTYRAQFELVETPTDALQAPSDVDLSNQSTAESAMTFFAALPSSAPPRKRSRLWWWLVPASLLLIAAVFLEVHSSYSAQERAFRKFWTPAMQGSRPVLIYTGTNVVYRFSPEFLKKYREAHNLPNKGPEFVVDLDSKQKFDLQDLRSSSNAYVTVGDVSACAAVVAMLAHRNKPYELRYASDISAGDIRTAPSVLIGAFNNPWTINVTDPLRFTFTRGDTIEDKFDKNRSWSVHLSQDGSTTDDYAIVTRLLNLKTGQVLFTAAGIGQYGTQAASEFLSSPQRIKEFADRAPRDWNQKNVQIVLHIKVVDDTPGTVDTVAVYYW
jgi:hypothetical protein